ncbi:hypothetical protein H2203_008057 [Taxawa tesnikishii (nom. ined.)]|nr:hypothetical protein H2203_008057 [Dothideales sp. JES 119]
MPLYAEVEAEMRASKASVGAGDKQAGGTGATAIGGMAGMGGMFGVVMSVEDVEKSLVEARRVMEDKEANLKKIIKRNRRLVGW